MYSQLTAMVAAERVKDMQAAASRWRRAREARRARRDVIGARAAARKGEWASQPPCPQLPCPPMTAQAA